MKSLESSVFDTLTIFYTREVSTSIYEHATRVWYCAAELQGNSFSFQFIIRVKKLWYLIPQRHLDYVGIHKRSGLSTCQMLFVFRSPVTQISDAPDHLCFISVCQPHLASERESQDRHPVSLHNATPTTDKHTKLISPCRLFTAKQQFPSLGLWSP